MSETKLEIQPEDIDEINQPTEAEAIEDTEITSEEAQAPKGGCCGGCS